MGTKNIQFRKASAIEAGLLNSLAISSEAYWGYDAGYMAQFKTMYSISKDFAANNLVMVLSEPGRIIGFVGLITDSVPVVLKYFYLDPALIGKGFGKIMWTRLSEFCKNSGIAEFEFVAAAQVKDFYIKMGAGLTGSVKSKLGKGRMIHEFIFRVPDK